MSEWKEFKLGEIGKVITGKTPPTKDQSNYGGRIPFVCIPDLGQEKRVKNTIKTLTNIGKVSVKNLVLPKDSVMVSCIATVGKVGITSTESVTNQQINSIIPNEELVIPDYLFYWFLNEGDSIGKYGGGGSVFNIISKSKFEQIPISIPPLPTQTAIAEILSSLDDKIELNNAINKNLEDLAQALFKRWFVDFEFPNEEGLPYQSSGGEMVESELGMIPEGWRVNSLDGIAEYLNGLALQKFPPENERDFLPVIKIREMRQGITDSSDKASTNIPEKYIVNNGDMLFSWSGSLVVDFWTKGKGALNQHLFKVRSEKFPKWFIYYWTRHHLEEFVSIAQSKATTMGHIQRKHLTDAKVLIPAGDQMLGISEIFEPIIDQIITNRLEANSLIEIRDTLLPKLISGELEVSQALSETEKAM